MATVMTLTLIEQSGSLYFRRDEGPRIKIGAVAYEQEYGVTVVSLNPIGAGVNSFAQDMAQEWAEAMGYGLMIPAVQK